MASEPTDKELELAARVNELDEAALRAVVTGSGLLAAAANFLMGRVSRVIMSSLLIVVIAYHGWESINAAQQLTADLRAKRAEVGQAQAEAVALTTKVHDATIARATLEADLQRTQGQAAAAKADADAQNANIGDVSMRLARVRAELEKTKAEADQAKADAGALTQEINGMPMAVAQEQADVAALEAEAKKEIATVRLVMSVGIDPGGAAGRAMDSTAGSVFP